ncbi:biotin biosynthesis cytochrome P450 (plasmid) [Cupriavidus necator N-1]|uniref:Biotin biosynthesis cytochrome P450 n=1 Tax=Cupriavidus necator (strain ATCC 43291 / DSM 13513 / CCUG 52238 / LMG 8453 / N-1) TaxID=1042878 RepID=F8GUB3_CUPNN|nr:cytochrome P450 [Cupriavidus necator]AEI82317.1 biotin biosynthesis cytochrome P450 [Cupriavidus necator N-1]MDX6007334.1 cytochrome P450 [Cupriavidus necator]
MNTATLSVRANPGPDTAIELRDPCPPILDAAFLRNPYPAYHRLRAAGPIHWSEEFFGGAWLLTRHEDVEAVLRDPLYSARRTGGWVMRGSEDERQALCPFQRLFSRAMLFLDAPDHMRLRQALNAGFRPAALRAFAGTIEQMATGLMDRLEGTEQFDFMEGIAKPLPAMVIASLLGADAGDQPDFLAWSEDLAAFIGSPAPDQGLKRRAQASLLKMSAAFEALLARRRAQHATRPQTEQTDLIGHLLHAEAEGRIEAGPELLAQCAMLLFAGHETTRNLLGNGLHALLSHPEQWQRLRQSPELLPNALRELLRYESPVQYTGRRVTTDMVLNGRRMQRGDLVVPLIGAANRDPARYRNPDELDITRREGSHLSFGHGPHVCIGAALTLMEAEIAFRALLTRWPGLELVESEPHWNSNPVYRGLASLQVRHLS